MDPAGVRSVLQTQLIKLMESRKHAHLHEYNFSLSVHFVRSASEGLGAIYPAAKWTQTTGGGEGYNFHGNDFAVQCQADVGRRLLRSVWFLLQSLILKLSLSQQIPPLSALKPHFCPSSHFPLTFLSNRPEALSVHLSAGERRQYQRHCISADGCFTECHDNSGLNQ